MAQYVVFDSSNENKDGSLLFEVTFPYMEY